MKLDEHENKDNQQRLEFLYKNLSECDNRGFLNLLDYADKENINLDSGLISLFENNMTKRISELTEGVCRLFLKENVKSEWFELLFRIEDNFSSDDEKKKIFIKELCTSLKTGVSYETAKKILFADNISDYIGYRDSVAAPIQYMKDAGYMFLAGLTNTYLQTETKKYIKKLEDKVEEITAKLKYNSGTEEKTDSDLRYFRNACMRYQKMYNNCFVGADAACKELAVVKAQAEKLSEDNKCLEMNLKRFFEERRISEKKFEEYRNEYEQEITRLKNLLSNAGTDKNEEETKDVSPDMENIFLPISDDDELQEYDSEDIIMSADEDARLEFEAAKEAEEEYEKSLNKSDDESFNDIVFESDISEENMTDDLTEDMDITESAQHSDTVAESFPEENEKEELHVQNINNEKLKTFSKLIIDFRARKFLKLSEMEQFMKIKEKMIKHNFEATRQKAVLTAFKNKKIDRVELYRLVCLDSDYDTFRYLME